MKRLKNRSPADAARARGEARARGTTAAKADSEKRVASPASSADARRNRQRTRAAVRMQVCANVFARSRIHFDARLGTPGHVGATDCAEALASARVAGDDDVRATQVGSRDEPITRH